MSVETGDITLSKVIKLSSEFLQAVDQALYERGVSRRDIRDSLTQADQDRLNALALEIAEIDQRAREAMRQGQDDPDTVNSFTAELNGTSLQMYDLLLQGAQNRLGRDYLTFIAPDELRTPGSVDLLERNKAKTLLGLTRLTYQ